MQEPDRTITEAQEQAKLFQWAKHTEQFLPALALMHHIPNGGSRNKVEAANLKRQGVKAGIPDIFLPCPVGGKHGLYIELKRKKGGKLSTEQKIMLAELNARGYVAKVCKGAEDAIDTILKYLEGKL